jgi:hypothetical protein
MVVLLCLYLLANHIFRPRTPKDYHYILSNLTSRGCNDPTSYTTRMRAAEMVGLTSSAFRHFEDQYGNIQEMRNVFHKQLALDSKIEKVQVSWQKEFSCNATLLFCSISGGSQVAGENASGSHPH